MNCAKGLETLKSTAGVPQFHVCVCVRVCARACVGGAHERIKKKNRVKEIKKVPERATEK